MYHFRSAHAAASSDAMSTVIDGADQAQYGLPYFAQDDKSTTNGLKYKVSSCRFCSCVFFNVNHAHHPLFMCFISNVCFVCCLFLFCSLLLVGVDKALRRSCPW